MLPNRSFRRAVLGICCLLTACSSRPAAFSDGDGETPPVVPSCPTTAAVDRTHYFSCNNNSSPSFPLSYRRGWLVYGEEKTFGTNSAEDLDLFALNPATEKVVQLTADDHRNEILATEGTTVLYYSYSAGSSPKEGLVLRTDEELHYLGDYSVSWPMGEYVTLPHRYLDNGQAVWTEGRHSYGSDGYEALYFFDGKIKKTLYEGFNERNFGIDPYLRNGVIVWSRWDGTDREIFRYAEGTIQQLTDNAVKDEHPLLAGSGVYWLCDDKVCSWRDGQTTVLDAGQCSALDADEKEAAWICGNRITYYNGQTAHLLAEDQGVRREGIRVKKGRLA